MAETGSPDTKETAEAPLPELKLMQGLEFEGKIPLDTLTPREKEVIVLIAQGLSDNKIGTTLFISSRTVEHDKYGVFGKWNIDGNHAEKNARVVAANQYIEQNSDFKNPFDNHEIRKPFSDRENEVLDLVAQGLSNKAIAKKLFVAKRTLEYHINSIFRKMNIDHKDTEKNARVEAATKYVNQYRDFENPFDGYKIYEPFSRREHEVLVLVGQGLSNKAIAKTLFIQESTVEEFINHILSKIDFDNKEQNARIVMMLVSKAKLKIP